jgi:hypothetical protein
MHNISIDTQRLIGFSKFQEAGSRLHVQVPRF